MKLFKRCACSAACRHPFWYRFRLETREYRGSTRTANQHLAQRILTRKHNDALEGKTVRRLPRVKLSAAIKTYLAHAEKEQRTANKADRVLTQFQESIGDRWLSDISTFQIEKWKLARAKDVEQSTVNRELNVIKGLFSRCVTWKYLQVSPARAVKRYRTDDTRIRVLSPQEIKTVLTKTPADISLLCRATLECLPRLSELLTLKRQHIGSSWIEIRRKGGHVERIAVPPELRTALLARAHGSGYIFGESPSGEPPTQEATSLRITRIMRKIGLHGVSHHTMRHTAVTMMLEAGKNPRAIQKLAGWTSLRMLERYGHARDAEVQSAVTTMHAALENAVNQSSERAQDEATTAVNTQKPYTVRAHTRAQRHPR